LHWDISTVAARQFQRVLAAVNRGNRWNKATSPACGSWSSTIRRPSAGRLKKEGCDVVTATDGFEALAKIADHQPQIIFVDIMMPRLDGYQTCALIKNNQMFKGTPVIMLSSKDGLFDKARGRIVGSDQYLTKPFTRDELLAAIRTFVTVAA